jgi:DNA-binding MarR family transcriptional regulator
MTTIPPEIEKEDTVTLTIDTLSAVMKTVMYELRKAGKSETLSLTQIWILQKLSVKEHLSSELACHLQSTPTNISHVIDGLVSRGLVERASRSDDRRTIPLRITLDGRTLLESVNDRIREKLGGIIDKLAPEETQALRQTMNVLKQKVEAETTASTDHRLPPQIQ